MYTGTIINNFLIISRYFTIKFVNTYYNDNKWDLKHVLLSSGNLVLGGQSFVTSFFRGCYLGVCGYTRTRGFTRTRPVPAGRVRVGYAFHGSGRVRVGSSRVRVYPVLPVPT